MPRDIYSCVLDGIFNVIQMWILSIGNKLITNNKEKHKIIKKNTYFFFVLFWMIPETNWLILLLCRMHLQNFRTEATYIWFQSYCIFQTNKQTFFIMVLADFHKFNIARNVAYKYFLRKLCIALFSIFLYHFVSWICV